MMTLVWRKIGNLKARADFALFFNQSEPGGPRYFEPGQPTLTFDWRPPQAGFLAVTKTIFLKQIYAVKAGIFGKRLEISTKTLRNSGVDAILSPPQRRV